MKCPKCGHENKDNPCIECTTIHSITPKIIKSFIRKKCKDLVYIPEEPIQYEVPDL
jgi:hypothetical protein